MKSFELLIPTSTDEAFALMDEHKDDKIQIIAGGTDTVPILRNEVLVVDYLLDITKLGLDEIEYDDECIKIGSTVTFNQIADNKFIKEKLPALAYASSTVGAIQTRSLATIGGNICAAVPSLDSAPVLLTLDAELEIISKDLKRIVPISEFFVGPRRTVLKNNEILSKIIIHIPKEKFGLNFIKFGRRKALTLSIVNSAVYMELDNGGKIAKVRIALGAVAPIPVRAYKSEEKLLGQVPSVELFEKVASNVDKEIKPISDIRASAEYREELSKVLVKRNLTHSLKQINN